MKIVKYLASSLLAASLVVPAVADVPTNDSNNIKQNSGTRNNANGQKKTRGNISASTAGVQCSFKRTPAKVLSDRADVAAKVASTCKAQGVDPALALSIAYQESQFNQNCRAPTTPNSGGERAEGVMQVLPATGKRLFRQNGLGTYNGGTNEDHNILAGCLYLKEGMKIANGSAYHVAGGYHAGYGSDVWRNNLSIPKGWPKTLNYAETVTKKWMPFFAGKTGGLGGGAVALDQFKANSVMSGAEGIESITQDAATMSTRLDEEAKNIGKFDSVLTEWQTNSKIKLFNAEMANQLIEALTLLAQYKMTQSAMSSGSESATSDLGSMPDRPTQTQSDQIVYDQVAKRWKLIRADGSWAYIDVGMPETVALVPTNTDDGTVAAVTPPAGGVETAAMSGAPSKPAAAVAVSASASTSIPTAKPSISAAARVQALLAE